MADYTLIVDDSSPQFTYGPAGDSWSLFNFSDAYQSTLHHAMTRNAELTFHFVGGREVLIYGKFIGDNDPPDSTAYPVFQVDSHLDLNCTPNPPQNGGQFVCGTSSFPSEVTNRTLTMFLSPDVAIQQFHIDYIRYGANSRVAQTEGRTVGHVIIKSPDDSTQGLSFGGDWQYQSIGGTNRIKKAMYTSMPSSAATYNFVGDSFAWWGCCMPAATPSNTANITYSIDRGEALSVQIDEQFMQSVQCQDERILFQTQPGQLGNGNHTMEVVYNGDETKMPLTLCGLAAVPLDYRILDVQSLSSNRQAPAVHPSSTLSPSITPSGSPSAEGNDHGNGPHQKSLIAIIVGVTSGVATFIFCIGIIWRRKMQAKQRGQRSRSSATDPLSTFAFHPVVGFVDLEKQQPTFWGSFLASTSLLRGVQTAPPATHKQDESSGPHSTDSRPSSLNLESRPPSYHSTRSSLSS